MSFYKFIRGRGRGTPLFIDDFKEIRFVSTKMPEFNERFVYKKPGGILLEYYNKNNQRIGLIRYYVTTGQIGLFFIEKAYRNRGLGKQILSKVIDE